jgi:hypothetical protein
VIKDIQVLLLVIPLQNLLNPLFPDHVSINDPHSPLWRRLQPICTRRMSLLITGDSRLINSLCNQLEAIKQTKVNMTVFLGNYPVPDDNTPYTRQRDLIKAAIQTYGVDHIAGVTVGNEFMLK